MWVELFFCLLVAHLAADFVFQTSGSCRSKAEEHEKSVHQYVHSLIVFALAWIVTWDVHFWWGALITGIVHLFTDIWKSYRPEDVTWFCLDQALHIGTLAGVAWLWGLGNDWCIPLGIELEYVVIVVALMVCWKPANFFIKLMLRHYSVNMPAEQDSGFNAGTLIGTIERWLILIFVCLQRYDALGLLVAAKSIIRFSERDTAKTEYVLAGTLLSILIAVLAGMMVMWVRG